MSVAGTLARGVVAAGVATAAWGIGVERNWYAIRRYTLPLLPAGAPDIRVLHLSDLHMAPWQHRKQRFVRDLAALKPDLVIDTGDNLGHEAGLLGLKVAFEPFRDVPGVFVWGSNDYWAPELRNPFLYFGGASRASRNPRRLDIEALGGYLGELGWRDIDNAATRLTVRGIEIDFVGVDDPHREYDRLDALPAALSAVRGEGPRAAITIGVAHAPYRRVLDDFVGLGADLVLSGHTHGGQVCVPGFGALVTNCDINREQVKGLSEWANGGRRAALEVSAGLGTSVYAPVRFSCRPEVSLLTLTAA